MPIAAELATRHVIDRSALASRYAAVRGASEAICAPLTVEDYVVQSMGDTSPPKWHLAHTMWFLEQFVLGYFKRSYEPFRPGYAFLFNSYYETVGRFFARAQRGLLSRPTVEDVYRYRAQVDRAMADLFDTIGDKCLPELASRVELRLQHEQQHQELLLTDIKHMLAINPLRPAYAPGTQRPAASAGPLEWLEHERGVREIGHASAGFCFDDETPRHAV